MSESTPRNPYVGPRSLRYGESIYGRDREARQLLELLIAERIVLLYSPSGAGKTSLIQAGLIPELEKEEFHVLPVIRVSRWAGGGAPPCNPYVMSALLSLEQGVAPELAIPAEELASMLFADCLTRRESAGGTGDGTFLIFDQFEEILTIDPMNRDAKIDFFNQVGDALRDLKRWALFAMREDHVAALDPYVRPIPTRLKATFRLDLLSAESARIAVQRPAKECGVEFTEGATTKLVDDLRQVAVQGPTGETVRQLGPYVEPVQLQVVCHRLWEKLEANVKAITEEHVAGTGDVDSALADYYAERVAQIAGTSGVKERVLREWFDRRLITESGLRSQVMVGSENTKELNAEAIQLLVDAHLIRGEERRGVTWLELAHDRLVNPIRTDNAAWSKRNLSVLQLQAAVWNNQGRPDALCLRGEARKEAQVWADEHVTELTQTEREFLEVCQRNHDARKNQWARAAVAVLTVVLLCFAVLAGIAVWKWIEATQQRKIAERERNDATQQRKIATALSIAARASLLLEERLDTALLLATEAQQRSNQPDTFGALITAAYYKPRLTTYLKVSPVPDLKVLPTPINAVAFNPDGTRVATGDYAGRVVLWDAKTHHQSEDLGRLVPGAVRAIAFSPDGRSMAVSGKGKTVVLRDPNNRRPLGPETESQVWSLAFSGDSKLLASGDGDGNIIIRDVMADSAVTLRTASQSAVRGLSFVKDTQIAAGCSDGRVLIWNRQADQWVAREDLEFAHQHPEDPELDPGRRLDNVRLDSDGKNVRCLMVSNNGKYLAVGRSSGAVDLYDLSTYDLSATGVTVKVAAFGRHDGLVNSLAFAPDSEHLITCGNDGTLRLWEVPSMKQVGLPFTGHVGRVFSVAFRGDNRTVASGGEDRCAILWDASVRADPARAETVDHGFSIAFSPDAAWEAYGFPKGEKDPKDPEAKTPDATVLLRKRDPADGDKYSEKELPPALAGGEGVPIVTFSGNGRFLATTMPNGKVRIYDRGEFDKDSPAGIEIDFSPEAPKKFTSIGLSHDGAMVAAGVSSRGKPAQVFAWEVQTRAAIFSEPLSTPEEDRIFAIAFSPDGRRLVTGGEAERAVIWPVGKKETPQPKKCRDVHTGSIRSVAFSPDGKTFATASGDTTLILWNADTGAQLAPPLTGHQAPVVTVAFSPDGELLASGSEDHSVILWAVGTKQRIGRLTGHTYAVRALAFTPDRESPKRLYSGSFPSTVNAGDGGIKNWDLDPGELRKICRQRANRELTNEEREVYIGGKDHEKWNWPDPPTPKEKVRPK